MKLNFNLSSRSNLPAVAMLLLMALVAPLAHADPTLWTGPTIIFTQFSPTPSVTSDTVLAGKVVLTRGINKVLYNAAPGSGDSYPPGANSPTDTEWAFGTIANYASIKPYHSLEYLRDNPFTGNFAQVLTNRPMVMHIISDDIYLSVKFINWGSGFSGGFTYQRSTPSAPPPTVSLTNPAPGAVFAAPANVRLGASASASGGHTVTNVQFFGNGTSLGSATASPFSLTANGLVAGAYSLIAKATDSGGLSSTSSPVSISVVTPVAVSNYFPVVANGQFMFDHTADPGLRYVVENSIDLTSWSAFQTNTASSNSVHVTDAFDANGLKFYRVGRLPNP